jgi:hypothetical protein
MAVSISVPTLFATQGEDQQPIKLMILLMHGNETG